MERVSRDLTLRTGTSSLRLGLVKDVGPENPTGASCVTSWGNLLRQKIGNRILLLTIDNKEIS